MDSPVATLVTAGIALLGSLVAGYFTWSLGRQTNKEKADTSAITGFSLLVNQIQEERSEQRQHIQRLLTEMQVMHEQLTDHLARIKSLESENHTQAQHILHLERIIIHHGINS